LYNFPTIVTIFEGEGVHGGTNVDEDYRIWNTIQFRRNPTGHPLSQIEFPITDASDKQHILLKRFKSDNVNKDAYRLQLQGKLVFKLLANNTTGSIIYPVYADVYTKSGTSPGDTYNVTENHTLKTMTYYEPSAIPNVEYKIRVSILNPYDFGNKLNYDI